MLQAIREKAQGWIAWAIVILISIPFALFGIQEYLGVDSNPAVANVNGVEIKTDQLKERVRDLRENMRRMLGDAYDPGIFDDASLQTEVLDRMIDEALLRELADDWNMRISDEHVAAYIKSIPSLQNGGQFDPGLYEATVRSRGFSKAGFETLVRADLRMQQLEAAIKATEFATDAELANVVRLAEQQRELRYVRIPASDYTDASKVTDEELRQYYEDHQRQFVVPERVRISYLRLNADALKDQVEVDEEGLREYFDTYREELIANQERRVRHILLETDGDGDAEKLKLANKLIEELKDGADFADLARQYSNDPGSAEDGGDLGWVNRGVMVEAFEDAVFEAQKDEIVGPVKTEYGYHIILVTDIRGGEEATFEQVRSQVEKGYIRQQAEELFYSYYERLADIAYESPDSLVPAAEALDLEIRESDWFSNGVPPAELPYPKVMNAAFSEDVLQRGNNSDVIELAPADAVVLRIKEHEKESLKPLDEVREEVRRSAAKDLAAEKARAEGKKLLADLKSGADLESIVGSSGWQIREAKVARTGSTVPAEVIDAAFSVPADEQGGTAYTGVTSAEGDYFLIGVTSVEDGDHKSLGSTRLAEKRDELTRTLADRDFRGVLDSLRSRADIEVFLK